MPPIPRCGPLSSEDLWKLVPGDWLLHGNALVQYIEHGETYTTVREAFVWLLRLNDTKYQLKSGVAPWWNELKFHHRDMDGMKVFMPKPNAPEQPSSEGAKAVAYLDAHATAVELGYPSLTEALEDLERLKAKVNEL